MEVKRVPKMGSSRDYSATQEDTEPKSKKPKFGKVKTDETKSGKSKKQNISKKKIIKVITHKNMYL